MKWFKQILSLHLLSSVVSCSGTHSANPNTKLTVHYYDNKEFSRGYGWDTAEDLQIALDSQTRPLIVIFSSDWCQPCETLKELIVRKGWRDDVILVDIDIPENEARWLLMQEHRIIPTLVYLDGKDDKGLSMSGFFNIVNFLTHKLGL